MLVVAGAGSGKTLTILGKIKYLIEEKNVKEEEILCISFTAATTNNLKEILKKEFKYNIDVFTFHKLSLNILQYEQSISNTNTLEYIFDEFFFSTILDSNKEFTTNKNLYNSIKKTCITFINLFKSNGFKIEKFDDLFKELEKEKNKYVKNKNIIILKIIRYIYIIYENELYSQNKIDFNDMIINSTNYIKENGLYKNYKYIIIDEYQDTSYIRYKLIKAIKECCLSKVFAVGDDFQSIYRFSGCDLNIFLNFEKYFGYTKILKIQNTYRNSNELIKVAGKFIMKNKHQIHKNLKSIKNNKKPIKIYYYKNIKDDFIKLINLIYNKYKSNILILGRNNFDINNYISNQINITNNEITYKENQDIKIKYMTVHKSKGLEEDNVILINITNDKLGFPSKITNNDIISLVLNGKENYPYEEERRLFYVALTRTKNNVFIFVNKNNESIFLKELITDSNKYIQIIN